MKEKFYLFYGGEYSQWYKSSMYDPKLDMAFNCCEQYMMYNKAMLFNDTKIADEIMCTKDPRTQKALGRKVKSFNVLDWEKYAEKIVERGNYLKFTQNIYLLKMLTIHIKDGYTLFVEASPYDKIWGIGLNIKNDDCYDKNKWNGKNWLGSSITNVAIKIIKDYNL